MTAKTPTQGPFEIRMAGKTAAPCVYAGDVPVARFERITDAEFFIAAHEALSTIVALLNPENRVRDAMTATSAFEVARDALRQAP